jgi:metal-dependent amidase/aminoacylase/carboxypeptidase family protein
VPLSLRRRGVGLAMVHVRVAEARCPRGQVALRTDLDALPMTENNHHLPHRSVKYRRATHTSPACLRHDTHRAASCVVSLVVCVVCVFVCSEGVAHMCGHDGHMACLIGAATLLVQVREPFFSVQHRLIADWSSLG